VSAVNSNTPTTRSATRSIATDRVASHHVRSKEMRQTVRDAVRSYRKRMFIPRAKVYECATQKATNTPLLSCSRRSHHRREMSFARASYNASVRHTVQIASALHAAKRQLSDAHHCADIDEAREDAASVMSSAIQLTRPAGAVVVGGGAYGEAKCAGKTRERTRRRRCRTARRSASWSSPSLGRVKARSMLVVARLYAQVDAGWGGRARQARSACAYVCR